MKLLPRLTLLLLAALSPPAHAASEAETRHLLIRTGFNIDATQLQTLESLPYDQAVDTLVAAAAKHTVADTPPPDWVNEPLPRPRKLKNASPEEKKAYIQDTIRKSFEVQGWWMREIVNTPEPLAEHMTLFWHNHFTSSLQKVKVPVLLYRQNLTLRRYALGNFREFLHAIAHDPAMIVYLDNLTNRDQHPNENFARELMELFTLGIGHYSESDVKEAARAFTGWSIDRDNGDFKERRRWHDGGEKTFLGHRGKLDGDDVIDIILAQPQTAQFIVEKLWREFVSPEPDPQQVQQLAAQFRKNYAIAPLLAALLKTPQFRDPDNYGTLTKSPIDLVAGTLRSFSVTLDDGRFPAVASARLGQALFNPPNVKGWPGSESWINSQTLVQREQFLQALGRGFNSLAGKATDQPMMKTASNRPENLTRAEAKQKIRVMILSAAAALDMDHYLGTFSRSHSLPQAESLLLAVAPVTPPTPDSDAATWLRALLVDPAYEVK
jgi:uncharacterized protein (DUF1800 family)